MPAARAELLPDFLISDVVMHGMTGADLAIDLDRRSRTQNTSVLPASCDDEPLGKAREGGHSFDLLSTPVHPVDLLAKLRAERLRSSHARAKHRHTFHRPSRALHDAA